MRLAKLLLFCLIGLTTSLALRAHSSSAWRSTLAEAQTAAHAENKLILVHFSGSDWCGWCMKLKGEVFETEAFNDFADANLILLEVDLPRNKPQSVAQRQKNEALMDQFGVKGFPTLGLLSERGKPVGQLSYMAGGPMPMMNAMADPTDIHPSSSAKSAINQISRIGMSQNSGRRKAP